MRRRSRDGRTRTADFLLPKQALYQAELRPVGSSVGPSSDWTPSESGAKLAHLSRINHILALFAAGLALVAAAPPAFAAPTKTSETGLLQAVNTVRTGHGLGALRLDPTLRRAARSHSLDMLRRDYFAHGAFGARMAAFHVRGSLAGENLAWGTGLDGQARTIVAEWLASSEHRANLLRRGFTRIGFGIVRGSFLGSAGSTVVTADFAG